MTCLDIPAVIVREHDEPDDPVRCGRCGEPVYFVAGVVGPARWKHVATDDHVCAPTCKPCGAPATNRITNGHGVHSHWECDGCAAKTFRIERT